MIDRNRHAEPICDWSDLPISGCAHCHGRHDNPEPLGVRTPPSRPGRPVDLGGYRGEPYYRRAESLPMPDHGPICACGRPAGDAFVCPACMDGLEVCLGDVPALVEDLEVAAQKRDRVTVGTRRARMPQEPLSVLDGQWWTNEPSSGLLRDSGDDARVTGEAVVGDVVRRWSAILGRNRPDRAAAAAALDALHDELVAAVRVLLDPIGKTYTGDPSSVGLSRWLLRHVTSVRLSPAGPDVVTGMARVHRRALAIIDNAGERILYGHCLVEMDDGQPCGEPIAPEVGKRWFECPGCRSYYDAEQLAELRREWAMEQNLTVAQLAEVVGRSRHSVSGLLRRRGIASVGSVIEDGKPVALYPARAIIEATREASA